VVKFVLLSGEASDIVTQGCTLLAQVTREFPC
jgi:hypothetical protein